MKASVAEIKRVFFAAMMQGYAVDGPKETLPDGSKQYRHTDGHLEVIDRYWVNEGGFNWGQTLITFQGQPVWLMQYWGQYDKAVIPFLKTVLRENYEQGIFLGGRGPQIKEGEIDGDLFSYYNDVDIEEYADDFTRFSGEEEVFLHDKKGRGAVSIGWHRYHGGLLFKPD